jgi:hypothetical protein
MKIFVLNRAAKRFTKQQIFLHCMLDVAGAMDQPVLKQGVEFAGIAKPHANAPRVHQGKQTAPERGMQIKHPIIGGGPELLPKPQTRADHGRQSLGIGGPNGIGA